MNLARFIFELGQLKRIRHEGWRLIGVQSPETVAAHSARAAQIAYILAVMAQVDNPHRVVTMVVFHDMGETRVGDLHKVARRYVTKDEQSAVEDQVEDLPEQFAEIASLWSEMENCESLAGELAYDADLLEQAFTAHEYANQGYERAIRWAQAAGRHLRTDVAKSLYQDMLKMDPYSWWDGLKKYDIPE